MNQAPTQLEVYRGEVLPPEKASELWQALPSHIKPAVFERNLMNALMANPDLMQHDPRLVYREVAKAAGLGLLLDPLLGEGYLVVAYNYKTKNKEPQLRVGYKGMCKLARQTGEVGNIYAHEVHEKDHVEVDLGFPKIFHHKPVLFGDRGPIIGYVALITFDDGTFDFEPMSVQQCHDIRDRSDAWKAFSEGKIKSTPWSTDDSEMSKKTVLRRLLKRQQQSPEMVAAQRIEDDAEFPNMARAIAPSTPRDAGPPRAQAITEQPGPATIDGEIVEDEPEQQRTEEEQGAQTFDQKPETAAKAIEPYMLPVERETFASLAAKYIKAVETSLTPGDVFKWAEKNYKALDQIAQGAPAESAKIKKASEEQLRRLQGTQQPAPDKTKPATPKRERKAKAPKDAPKDGPEAMLATIEAELAAVESADGLEKVWHDVCLPLLKDAMPPDQDEAQAIYQRHEKRLGGD